jgi:NADP-dependent 3-hydroxy acid dehydrogenase YdfG
MDLSDNITGKIIVITGASSGLGETTARHLASKGANVVLEPTEDNNK